mmetsp:Transcript_4949/g.7623  ORF Transcript_4949/g.7623 Transcript_4949/m.7623 type:complete len:96 (+) Transcript_4949:298-585(+)
MEADNHIQRHYKAKHCFTSLDQQILFTISLQAILSKSIRYKHNWLALCTDCLAQLTLLPDDTPISSDATSTINLPRSTTSPTIPAIFHINSPRIR